MDEFERFNITNYRDHPTNQRYTVFSFRSEERANYFEQLLVKENIPFERATDVDTEPQPEKAQKEHYDFDYDDALREDEEEDPAESEKDGTEEYYVMHAEVYMFGVENTHFKLALRQNFLTEAKFRRAFISDVPFRWLVLVITIVATALAIWRYSVS
jgi:hypothetical protein